MTTTTYSRKCSTPGCPYKHVAKGLCQRCYEKQRRGTLQAPVPTRTEPLKPCPVCGLLALRPSLPCPCQTAKPAPAGAKPSEKIGRPAKPRRTCSEPGCTGAHIAYGLCSAHYQRARASRKLCCIEGCPKQEQQGRLGMCQRHHKLWLDTGSTDEPVGVKHKPLPQPTLHKPAARSSVELCGLWPLATHPCCSRCSILVGPKHLVREQRADGLCAWCTKEEQAQSKKKRAA